MSLPGCAGFVTICCIKGTVGSAWSCGLIVACRTTIGGGDPSFGGTGGRSGFAGKSFEMGLVGVRIGVVAWSPCLDGEMARPIALGLQLLRLYPCPGRICAGYGPVCRCK